MALFKLSDLYRGPELTPLAMPTGRRGRPGAGSAQQWQGYRQAKQGQDQQRQDWFNKMIGNLESDITDLSGKQEGLLNTATGLLESSAEGFKDLTPDYRGEMDRAESDVGQEFSQSREATTRGLARYGLNPSSGRYVGAQRRVDIGEAGARAGARTQAFREERGRIEGGNLERAKSRADLVGSAAGLAGIYGNAAAGLGTVADRFAATSGPAVSKQHRNIRWDFQTPLG